MLAQLKEEGINTEDTSEVLRIARERLKKEPGQWRHLAQCFGAVSKENEIMLEELPKEKKGQYSDIPQMYKFMLDAPFFISSNCCKVMKKKPAHDYQKQTGRNPITAQMAAESRMRTRQWLMNGCNMYNAYRPISNPMSFWTEQDVYRYIVENDIKIASVYGDIVEVDETEISGQMDLSDFGLAEDTRIYKTTGLDRTGCMFCGYGCQHESCPGRFERMKETHPKLYDYIMRPKSEGGLNYKEVIDWMNDNGHLNIRY